MLYKKYTLAEVSQCRPSPIGRSSNIIVLCETQMNLKEKLAQCVYLYSYIDDSVYVFCLTCTTMIKKCGSSLISFKYRSYISSELYKAGVFHQYCLNNYWSTETLNGT